MDTNVKRMRALLRGDGQAPQMDHAEVRTLLGPGFEHSTFGAGPVGAGRLVRALQTRFGADYAMHPQARAVIGEHRRLTDDTRLWLKLKKGTS